MAILLLALSPVLLWVRSNAFEQCSSPQESNSAMQQGVTAASLAQLRISVVGQSAHSEQQLGTASADSASQTLQSMNGIVEALAEKTAGHNYTMTQAEKTALDTIKAFIQGMRNTTDLQHSEDQKELDRARDLIQGCSDDANTAMAAISGLNSTMQSNRLNHTSCRESEASLQQSQSSACSNYHTYRTTNAKREPPVCLTTKLSTAYIGTTDETGKKQMESCLQEAKNWLEPLYEKYILCQENQTLHKNYTVECSSKQNTFEQSFCAYASKLESACDEQKSCRDRTVKARDEAHAAVVVSEAARKADFETGERILCLFAVFDANNTNKTATLSACFKKNYSTAHYDISYHSVPAVVPCTKESYTPCDAQFLQGEYTSKGWYSKAPTAACNSCPPAATTTATTTVAAPTPAPPSYKLSDKTCAQDETGKTLGPSDVGTVPTGSSAYTVDITFMPGAGTAASYYGTLVRWGTIWHRSVVVRMSHSNEVRLIANRDAHFSCKPGFDLKFKTHRYVASYDGTTRRAWIDGVKCGEDTPPKPDVDKQTPFCIGYLLTGGTERSFNGTIENVHIYDSDVHNQLGLQA